MARDASFDSLLGEIEVYFPVLEGYVVELKGDTVFVDLGVSSGVKNGMELFCIREGGEFAHPITGEILGRFEDKVGIIQIQEIKEKYSLGKILEQFSGLTIKRGDKVRLSNARIPVALLYDESSENSLQDFIDIIGKSNRFTLIQRETVIVALNDFNVARLKEISPLEIKKIGAKLGISALLVPSLMESNEKRVLQLQVFSARTGLLIAQIGKELEKLPSSFTQQTSVQAQKVGEGEKKFEISPQSGILTLSQLSDELPITIQFMQTGDISGDGKKEICVSDGQNISLFSLSGGKLKEMYQMKGSASEKHLSMDIADINRNGRDEIFISSLDKDTLRSFVLEWEGNGLRKIWDSIPLYLRVMTIYPEQRVLLGQGMGIATPFDNNINKYVWKDSKYFPEKRFELPTGVTIFDIGMADFNGDGRIELAHLSQELVIYKDNERIWKSESGYGEKSYFFDYKTRGAISTEEEAEREYLSSHLLIGDFNKNGTPDIMVIKNVSSTGRLFPQSRLFRQGEACLVEWNGISFSEVWRSGKIDAYLSDIEISDLNNDGNSDLIISLVLLKGIDKFWKKTPSKILWF